MGWRERDYARFTKKEWSSYLGGHDHGRAHEPGRGPGRAGGSLWNQRVGWPVLLAALVSLGALLVSGHFRSFFGLHVQAASSRPVPQAATLHSPSVVPPSESLNLVRIRWQTDNLAPAPNAGRICVTDVVHGRICASYVAGERPADTLTRRIRSLGLRVESSR